jgi:hypothetical protein
MTWVATTLWEMIAPSAAARKKTKRAIVPRSETIVESVRKRAEVSATIVLAPPLARRVDGRQSMQDKYDALVEEMKYLHDVRVRKWRKSSSGVAWLIRYHSGKTVRLIESPYPRGPMSCAIFMHEIGHHAIGLGVYRPRCLEEYHVWVWALREMRERGFNVTPAVEKRMHDSMKHAVRKARRRGLQSLPVELREYL